MNIILVIVIGGIIGWIASMIMRTDAQQGVFMNIVVGVVGSLLAGFGRAQRQFVADLAAWRGRASGDRQHGSPRHPALAD